MTIQDKIIYYLAKNKIKQSEFAKKLGVSCAYISQIKNGRHPSRVMAKRIEIFIEEN